MSERPFRFWRDRGFQGSCGVVTGFVWGLGWVERSAALCVVSLIMMVCMYGMIAASEELDR